MHYTYIHTHTERERERVRKMHYTHLHTCTVREIEECSTHTNTHTEREIEKCTSPPTTVQFDLQKYFYLKTNQLRVIWGTFLREDAPTNSKKNLLNHKYSTIIYLLIFFSLH